MEQLKGYKLPFAGKVEIIQGRNGPRHQRISNGQDWTNAVDFMMPPGTEVRAARNGIVIAVLDFPPRRYRGTNPVIGTNPFHSLAVQMGVGHEDGTYAVYSHLSHGEIRVAAGDTVNQGQVIALSGEGGWEGPMRSFLHFQVNILRKGRGFTESLPVEFDDLPGSLDHAHLLRAGLIG